MIAAVPRKSPSAVAFLWPKHETLLRERYAYVALDTDAHDYLDMVGVVGSNPIAPTKYTKALHGNVKCFFVFPHPSGRVLI